MIENITLPEGYILEEADGGFRLTAPLPCPVREARCLAVAAACWVRNAVGGAAKIRWPNHVTVDEKRVCAIECRAADKDIMFTFRPDWAAISAPPDAFAGEVCRAAAEDMGGYPENQPELMAEYCEHCVTVMKFVNVTYRGVPIYGFAFAVDKHGGLMVMTQESHTVITVYGGQAEIVQKGEEPDDTPEIPVMPGR